MPVSRVAIAFDPDRASGARKVINAIGLPDLKGKNVFVKPNYNTADTPPGSTHSDTLRTAIELIKSRDPRRITVGDRSGPADTAKVFREKGTFEMAEKLGFDCLIIDEMPKDRWTKVTPPDCHWLRGFWFAKPVLEADAVISLCCLKTHQYGGHFTMSLKNTAGCVHRRNMAELHTSVINQRKMIAETNYPYKPALIVMDGVEAFYTAGPMTGDRWTANLTFASTDRVALDAVGVATLKMHGSTRKINDKAVFEHDQIARAIELGLGAANPGEVEIVPVDEESRSIAEKITAQLEKG
jgi:uncharacterized protein (DUF362 family)